MRFIVHASVLDAVDESAHRHVDRLLDRIVDEIHRIELPEADRLQESSWYRGARPTMQKFLMLAVGKPPRAEQGRQGPHTKAFEVRDAESARVADRLAHAPLRILVEDREADGILLEIIVEELGKPAFRELWKRACEVTPRGIEMVSAGGIGNIPQRVRRMIRDAAEERRPPRLFVLCDRDTKWPEDKEPKAVGNVRDICREESLPHHVLWKRCAENYIPDKVFEAIRGDPRNRNKAQRFDALLRRTPVQRDHFPIKNGLTAGEREKATKKSLYTASEEADLLLLEECLLPKERLKTRPFQLLQAERREDFTAEGLRSRDGQGELDELLDKISREL